MRKITVSSCVLVLWVAAGCGMNGGPNPSAEADGGTPDGRALPDGGVVPDGAVAPDGGGPPGDFTAAQILAAVQARMTANDQVNSKPHINTMTRAMNVNVYQVTSGVYAYTSSMAVDTDGSDPDPDPDHQPQTTWTDDDGVSLGAHHVPYYVLGDYCYEKVAPCPHFYYAEHGIAGLQFALIFYNGKVIGAVTRRATRSRRPRTTTRASSGRPRCSRRACSASRAAARPAASTAASPSSSSRGRSGSCTAPTPR
jgi:hypothetical protein